MAKYNSSKSEYTLTIDGKYYSTLDIAGFSMMLKDPSFCYKFYWLEAIVKLISEGVTETTFNDIIDEMIANAWYSIREYHIHLSGLPMDNVIRDGLERAVVKLAGISNLASKASKVEIKNTIKTYDSEIKREKEQLTNMVPYRALAGFFTRSDEICDYSSVRRTVAYIEKFNNEIVMLPYTLGTSSKLSKEVYFQKPWIEMIQNHTVSILGWIQYEKVLWLQKNNPEVPGLVYKLSPDNNMRNLGKVRNLWEAIIDIREIRDIFTDEVVKSNNYDVDHFIPWSFVMNDELWNLMPMDSSLNSIKSNKLPKWEPYFKRFAGNQYILYNLINDDNNQEIRRRYEKCFKDNLHCIWAGHELYKKGNSRDEFYNILNKNMRPVYDSAIRQGYEMWEV